MSDSLLHAIKGEKRERLGKRFIRWVDYQWDYEKGSFNKWRVSEERALREITESILLDPSKCYFVYIDNKLQSFPDDIDFLNTIHIDILVFKELLREERLSKIGI